MRPALASDADILEEIEAFCATHAMGVTTFGRSALGDPNLVAGLRNGRSLTLKTAKAVTDFIRDARAAGSTASLDHDAERAIDDDLPEARQILCDACDARVDQGWPACPNSDCPRPAAPAAPSSSLATACTAKAA